MYAQHQAALAELTQSVLHNIDLPNLMRQAVTLSADTLAVAYSAIWELLPDGSTLIFREGIGWPEEALGGMIVGVATNSLIGDTILHARPVIVTDWPSERRFARLALLRERGVVSSLSVVIPGPSGPFGSLGVDVTANRMFSAEEVHFLEAVANVLALAIARDQLNQTFEQRVEERTHEIEQRLVAAAQEKAVLEERQRLARDLHDSMTQVLYGVTLHAEAARRLLAADDVATAANSLRMLQDAAQEVLDEMRLLIFDLRPPILEQAGLPAALQARLEAVEGRINLETKLIADGVDALPPSVEQALYRIAQEALNNALKHARPRHITVQLQQMPTQVILEISDDGDGFDSAGTRRIGGMGLRGIAERVHQLAGRYSVQSSLGAGTQLRVEIPL